MNTRSPESRRRSKATSTNSTLHLVGGKGGVGKTTCAAAIALSEAARGRRTLLLSTDPASSLGDVVGQPVDRSPQPLHRRTRLHAANVDAPHALARWLAVRRPVLARIALRGTWLDEEDVTRLLRLALPGIDEIAALLEIARHARSGRYDTVVVDTAPTGHTMRMLRMPATLQAVAHVFDHMQAKHRVMTAALRGRWEPDAADALVAELDRDGRELALLLRDPARAGVSWVTLPETLAIEETLDALNTLAASGIVVTRMIANRITPPPPGSCHWCSARRVFEGRAIAPLRRAYPKLPMFAVGGRPREPRGLRALAEIARDLEAPGDLPAPRGALRRARPRGSLSRYRSRDAVASLSAPGLRLLMFGGKGGVGKTTCAAAVALTLARRDPVRRILLLSTDPAHSLGDALGERLSDTERTPAGAPRNLRVRELDATRGFQQVRDRYGAAIDAIFDRLSRGSAFEALHDRQVMRDLIDLAPPGVDELAAIVEVIDALTDAPARSDASILVMDTAPSGHALRLLESPALVQNWAKALMSILLKYQPLVGLGDLGAMLLRLSQATGRLRALLADAERTRFAVVTRAGALPRAETLRLLARLRAMEIPVASVIVNAAGAGTCSRCRQATAAEEREIEKLRRALRRHARSMLVAPAEMPPPRGAAALDAWGRRWSAL